MKRREFNKSMVAASAMSALPFSLIRNARAASGGATPVFSFANFSGSPGAIYLQGNSVWYGTSARLMTGVSHHGGGAYYTSQQPPNAFTTQFTFRFTGLGSSVAQSGFFFVVENTQFPPSQNSGAGLNFGGDANMGGYGGAMNQFPPVDAIGVKFDVSNQGVGQNYPRGGLPSSTGLYLNQGTCCYPGSALGQCPLNDLTPYGINFYSGNTYQATIVYDGTLLTLVLLDTGSNAQARVTWPLNLANTTNSNGNYVGFSSGSATDGIYLDILSWSYWTGYNTRLAPPTFSPSPGNYPGAQTVTINSPSGSICYYTTNGLLPTSASTTYTGPISVSANQVLQAVAIQSAGYTDSLVASANYVIGTSANPINFPSGFSAGNLIPVGYAYLNGSTYRLSDTTNNSAGAVWFPIPVTVSTFATTFTLNWSSPGQGMCFVLQNNTQPYTALSGVQITGTSGQISFNAKKIKVGQYVTVAGNFGGTGSISGYSNPTLYFVGATDGNRTATLQTAAAYSPSQSGTTFNTYPQALTAGTMVTLTGGQPGGFVGSSSYYVLSSGLSSTTCELAATPGGSAISAGSSVGTYLVNAVGQGSSGTLNTTPGTPTGLTFSLNASGLPAGPTVMGTTQSGLGYAGMNAFNGSGQAFGIPNSVAVAFNQYPVGSDPTNGVGIYTNGANPWGSQTATGLSFVGSFNVTLSYDGTTLSLSMQSTNGGTIFTHSWTIDIPSTVGLTTAYVGFTGSTGGAASVQAVQSWTYTASTASSAPAVPAAPTNLVIK